MTNTAKAQEILGDPLSDIARKERRNLLLSVTVSSFVIWTGVVPTEISTLGIDLSLSEQLSFFVLLGLIVTYFLLAFLLYGFSDYLIWREKLQDYMLKIEFEVRNTTPPWDAHPDDPSNFVADISWVYKSSRPLARLRVFFDFILPVVLGLGTIVALTMAT